MKRAELVEMVARMTLIAGSYTGFESQVTKFAENKSEVLLIDIFRSWSMKDLTIRMWELIEELNHKPIVYIEDQRRVTVEI